MTTPSKFSEAKPRQQSSLLYHSLPKPGKMEIVATKPLATQDDLALAYTPGVADVCLEIKKSPEQADYMTIKSNLVLVVTNGTAVLGLGNIGPLAAKPVMEGKAVLFKKFAGIDVFDLEIDEKDPDKLVDIIASLEPTCGGVNLEDIKAPECFIVEQKLKERMKVPVFHDDQHGTAIVVTAAFINAMHLAGKEKDAVKIVFSGAGAAGMACVRMLVDYGVPKQNITLVDIDGVVYSGRPHLLPYLEEFAWETDARDLGAALVGADVFVGVSAAGVLKPEMLAGMNAKPIIFALANPTPEIMPTLAKEARPDAIIGTGRSDFPNQINNALCFPYIFRGALDCGATSITTEMKLAAAEALAALARAESDASLDKAYQGETLTFGETYLLPKPFDGRLVSIVAPAVAKAAMASGVATRPIDDLAAYALSLKGTTDQSFTIMRHVFNAAKQAPKRVVYPEGEDPRVLKAAQQLVTEGLAHPILIGREDRVLPQLKKLGLSMKDGKDFTFVNPNTCPKMKDYAALYYDMRKRDGILPPEAEIILSSRWAALAAMMLNQGDADAMVAGVTGRFDKFIRAAKQIVGLQDGVENIYALELIMHKDGVFFIGDTHVNEEITAEGIAEMSKLASDEARHFGIEPRVALLSHSHFGSSNSTAARKMREALRILNERHPDVLAEGEMQADAAMNMDVMQRTFPYSRLTEPANILMMPGIDSASIAFNLVRHTIPNAEHIGPILLGMRKVVHILSVHADVRQIVNISALAVVESQNLPV